MEEVFITWAEKQTIMCLCRVTGRSGHVDQTLRSVHPEHQCLQCDRTRLVTIFPLWNLTGVNRTLALSVRSLTSQCLVTSRRLHLDQMN